MNPPASSTRPSRVARPRLRPTAPSADGAAGPTHPPAYPRATRAGRGPRYHQCHGRAGSVMAIPTMLPQQHRRMPQPGHRLRHHSLRVRPGSGVESVAPAFDRPTAAPGWTDGELPLVEGTVQQPHRNPPDPAPGDHSLKTTAQRRARATILSRRFQAIFALHVPCGPLTNDVKRAATSTASQWPGHAAPAAHSR